MSSLSVGSGAIPPFHLTPPLINCPLTLHASPYVIRELESAIIVIVVAFEFSVLTPVKFQDEIEVVNIPTDMVDLDTSIFKTPDGETEKIEENPVELETDSVTEVSQLTVP